MPGIAKLSGMLWISGTYSEVNHGLIPWRLTKVFQGHFHHWFLADSKIRHCGYVEKNIRPQLSLFRVSGGDPLISRVASRNAGRYEGENKKGEDRIFERVFTSALGATLLIAWL
jgi:hypothetical protein